MTCCSFALNIADPEAVDTNHTITKSEIHIGGDALGTEDTTSLEWEPSDSKKNVEGIVAVIEESNPREIKREQIEKKEEEEGVDQEHETSTNLKEEEETAKVPLCPKTPDQAILPKKNRLWAPRAEGRKKSFLDIIKQTDCVQSDNEEKLCFDTDLQLFFQRDGDEKEEDEEEEEKEGEIRMKLIFDGDDLKSSTESSSEPDSECTATDGLLKETQTSAPTAVTLLPAPTTQCVKAEKAEIQ